MARGHRVEKDTDGQSDESGRALRSVCFCPISILLISPVRRNNYWIIGLMGKKMTSLSGLHRKMLPGCRKSRGFPGKSRITGKWQTHIYADAFKHVQNSTVFRWFRLIFRQHCLHFQISGQRIGHGWVCQSGSWWITVVLCLSLLVEHISFCEVWIDIVYFFCY